MKSRRNSVPRAPALQDQRSVATVPLQLYNNHTSEAACTNSEFGSSDTALLANNHQLGEEIPQGRFVHRFIDRFRHSLIGGLLRSGNSLSLKASHNAEPGEGDEEAAAAADAAPANNADTVEDSGAANSHRGSEKLSAAAAARKAAEPFYTVETELYSLSELLQHYAKSQESRCLPPAMKYVLGRRPRPRNRGGGGRREEAGDASPEDAAAAACCVHPLLDRLVVEFCRAFGMMEVPRLPSYQERMFLWLSRDKAQRMLAQECGPGEQVYFVNLVSLDHVLTDLQCLCTRLSGCVACEGQSYPAHCCTDRDKIREQHRGPSVKPPRVAFIGRQVMCKHVYLRQDFGVACEVRDCPNYGKRLCACFQMDMFIPDTMVLATKAKFEHFRTNLAKKVYGEQRWLVRAANLKAGNGVQLIDTVSQLETFMRYDLERKLRGQFFVVQRNLKNPLLLENRRFDLRMFLLVCVLTDRRVVAFLHPGYLRLAQKEYDPASDDLRCHLTWPFTWDPDYNRYGKDGQKATKDASNATEVPSNDEAAGAAATSNGTSDYCRPYAEAHEGLGLPAVACTSEFDASLGTTTGSGNELKPQQRFLVRLQRIVQYLVGHIDSLIADKPGSWQLFGLDLMLDADKEAWLHDVMSYPCRGEPDPRSAAQNRVIPAALTEALALTMELNQRDYATRKKGLWLDLPDAPVNQPGLIAAQKHFVWMYSSDVERLISCRPQRQRTKPAHWYNQWRINEDLNDYILYLKNYRLDHVPLDDSHLKTLYGRKSFEHSPAQKFRLRMKVAAGGGEDGGERGSALAGNEDGKTQG